MMRDFDLISIASDAQVSIQVSYARYSLPYVIGIPLSDLLSDNRPSHIAWQKLDRSVLQLYEIELRIVLLEQT